MTDRPHLPSVHVYGKAAAICLEQMEDSAASIGLLLSAAKPQPDGTWGWRNKISIRLSEGEIAGLLAVVYGWMPSFAIKGHGESKEKASEWKGQGDRVYVTVTAKGEDAYPVPILGPDLYRVGRLLHRTLMQLGVWSESPAMERNLHNTLVRLQKK